MSVKVVDGMPEAEYHAHDSLSSSGAKKLLPPHCPAVYQWERTHRVNKRVFDFGHAAHGLVLGVGEPLAVLPFADYRGKAAQEAKQAAYAAGEVPLLAAEHETVKAMAQSITEHPMAGAIFNPDRGQSERSIFWHDERHDVARRARPDWLLDNGGRVVVVDYKTCPSADPAGIGRIVANFGYHQQAAWYIDAARAADIDGDASFLFVFQQKEPPHLVTVVELDREAIDVGRARNEIALEVYAECTATGVWPGYTNDIELIGLPSWATRTLETL